MSAPEREPWPARVYARLLRAYPPAFRDAWGEDMLAVFRARCRRALETGGRLGLALELLHAALDVAWNAPQERIAVWARGARGRGGWARDFRYALRLLGRQPGFTTTLALTLALGSGATTALFTVVDGALLRPLPYPDAERLVSVRQMTDDFGEIGFAPPFLEDLRDRLEGMEALAGFSPSWELTLRGSGEPRNVVAAYVSDGLLELLGILPVRGRLFTPLEHAPGGPAVAVVGEAFFERHFGADAPLDGRTIELDGAPYRVVGVVAAAAMPITASVVDRTGESAELWLPFASNPVAELRTIPVMNVIGRMPRRAEALAHLRAQTVALAAGLERDFPGLGESVRVRVDPLRDVVTADVPRTVLTLFGAAGLLLLIACVNVANLLLARASAREHELAVRVSLGAGRARILRQLLVECLVVAGLGCGAGLALAGLLVSSPLASAIPGLPPSADLAVDLRVAAFAAMLMFGTTLLFGWAPALRGARTSPQNAMRVGLRTGTSGRRLRRWLVAGEVALTVTLLFGAALLARSFVALTSVDPGFDVTGLLSVPIGLDGDGRSTPDDRRAFLAGVMAELGALPGAPEVAAVNRLPLSGGTVLVAVESERTSGPLRDPTTVDRRVATPGYFDVAGTPFVVGRGFSENDAADTQPVAVVNEAFARRFWGAEHAVGRRIRLMLRSGPGPWLEVVGVVGDVRHHDLARRAEPEVYVPYSQAAVEAMTFVLRTTGDPAALAAPARAAVWRVDPDVALDRVAPVERLLAASVAEPRFRTVVLNAFALLALALAGVGIYGMISFSVAREARETGVRMALGAEPRDLLARLVGEGVGLAAWGVVAGLAGAWALGRGLSGLLFRVEPADPGTFLGVATLVLAVALAASWIPALRATRVDPAEALRGR